MWGTSIGTSLVLVASVAEEEEEWGKEDVSDGEVAVRACKVCGCTLWHGRVRFRRGRREDRVRNFKDTAVDAKQKIRDNEGADDNDGNVDGDEGGGCNVNRCVDDSVDDGDDVDVHDDSGFWRDLNLTEDILASRRWLV